MERPHMYDSPQGSVVLLAKHGAPSCNFVSFCQLFSGDSLQAKLLTLNDYTQSFFMRSRERSCQRRLIVPPWPWQP